MGLEITCDESKPIPRRCLLRLTCDQHPASLLDTSVSQVFDQGGHEENYAAAMQAGWLERYGPQGRLFLCPSCSGKGGKCVAKAMGGKHCVGHCLCPRDCSGKPIRESDSNADQKRIPLRRRPIGQHD